MAQQPHRKSLWRTLAEWWHPPATDTTVSESWPYQDWMSGWLDQWNARLNWTDGWSIPPLGLPQSRRQGREFFHSEGDLSILRGQSRTLCMTNDYAAGFLTGVAGYVLGDGLTYRVAPKADMGDGTQEFAKNVAKACQKVVDRHLKRNQWWGGEQPGLEQEFFRRSRRDGSAILLHFPDDETGDVDERFAEPDMLKQPPNTEADEWSFGIQVPTRPYVDVQNHLAYNICWNYDTASGQKYDADRVLYYRVNVDRNIKVGLPDFCFDSYTTFDAAAKLRNALGEGAAQQASVAFICQHATARQEVVSAFVAGRADRKEPDFVSEAGRLVDVKYQRKGARWDIPKGMEYVEPPGGQNAPAHIQVADLLLRSAGRRWNAPEWLTSGDSSNNNYASSMTAENPFVIQIKCQQKAYCEVLGKAPWYALRHWINVNGLTVSGRKMDWEEVAALVEMQVTGPSPVAREIDKESNADKTYIDIGATSPQIVAERLGNDWHRVVRDREEASKIQQKLAPPPLMPGQNGKPQNGQANTNGGAPTTNGAPPFGRPTRESMLSESGVFDPSKHPRDKMGKFIPIAELSAAQRAGPDSPEASALREKVRPQDREKLERRLKGGKAGERKAAAQEFLKGAATKAGIPAEKHDAVMQSPEVTAIAKKLIKAMGSAAQVTKAPKASAGDSVNAHVAAALDAMKPGTWSGPEMYRLAGTNVKRELDGSYSTSDKNGVMVHGDRDLIVKALTGEHVAPTLAGPTKANHQRDRANFAKMAAASRVQGEEPAKIEPTADAKATLSDQENDALKWYGAYGDDKVGNAEKLNASLRATGQPPPKFAKEHAALQAAFAKTPPLAEPVTVFRGMNLSGKKLEAFVGELKAAQKEGRPATLPGYMSAAHGEDVVNALYGTNSFENIPSQFRGPVKIKIVARHGIDMVKSGSTKVRSEREFLLNHNSQFKVDGVYPIYNKAKKQQEYQIALTQIVTPPAAPAAPLHPKIPVYVRGEVDPEVARTHGAHWNAEAKAFQTTPENARKMKAALPHLTYTMPRSVAEFYHPELGRTKQESADHPGEWLYEDEGMTDDAIA